MRHKKIITKLLQSATEVYYKVRQVLQSVTGCYYKGHQVLQRAKVISKYDVTQTEKRTCGLQIRTWGGGGGTKINTEIIGIMAFIEQTMQTLSVYNKKLNLWTCKTVNLSKYYFSLNTYNLLNKNLNIVPTPK